MKLLNFFKKAIFWGNDGERVAGSVSWFSRLFGFNTDFDYDSNKMLVESYANNPYFFNVVDRIARIASAMPRDLMDSEGNVIERPDKDQQQLLTLLKRPAPTETMYTFYYRLVSNYLLGNLFVYKELPAGFDSGMPAMLLCPVPSCVTIDESEQQAIAPKSYSFTYMNKMFNQVSPEKMLHMKRPNIVHDSFYGLSTTKPSASLWATSNEIGRSGYSLHKNKGIQGVMFGKGSKIMNPAEQEELQSYYNRNFGNNEHTGKVQVVSSEVGYLPMGVNPADLQSVSMNIELARAIYAIFDAPSQLFNDVAASTYSNYTEAKKAFYSDAIMPVVRVIDEQFSYFLAGTYDWCYKVNESKVPVLQEISSEAVANARSLYEAGLITLQEARIIANKDFSDVPEELNSNNNEDATQE